MNDYVRSVILGIVEGLTEFLPVSSTAHIRIAQRLLEIPLDDEFWKMYAIVIQLGAILSVLVYFRKRLMDFARSFPKGHDGDRTFITHPLSLVLLAFIVTAGPCLLIDKMIGENLESMKVIGLSLVIGGIVMWIIDAWAGRRERAARAVVDAPPLKEKPAGSDAVTTAPAGFEAAPSGPDQTGFTWRFDDVRPMQAMVIGAAQILAAAFPGTSRSMSTIAAGQLMKLSRPAALEFSFFLAIPVMFAATGYKLLGIALAARKGTLGYTMNAERWIVLLIGMVVSFAVALVVIHWFMQWVRARSFATFAVYRIVAGAYVLWLATGAA